MKTTLLTAAAIISTTATAQYVPASDSSALKLDRSGTAPAAPFVKPSAPTHPMTPAAPLMPVAVAVRSGNAALNLTCLGGGTANKLTSASVWGDYGSAQITGQRHQGFEDQVDVRLFAGDDRIRLPRTMLPPMHGGSDGWFRLKGVTADARSIRGTAAVNFINGPKVFIDRLTGTISISGKAGDFVGQCQAVAADAPAKF